MYNFEIEKNIKPKLILKSNPVMDFFENIYEFKSGKTYDVNIIAKTNSSLTTFKMRGYDDINFTNPINMGDKTFTLQSDGITYNCTFSEYSKAYFGVSIRMSQVATEYGCYCEILNISIKEDGIEIFDFDTFCRSYRNIKGTNSSTFERGKFKYRVDSTGDVIAPSIIYISNNGINTGLGYNIEKSISIARYKEIENTSKFLVFAEGDYNVSGIDTVIEVRKDLDILSIGEVNIVGGTFLNNPVQYNNIYSFDYIIKEHFDNNVKNGIIQPKISLTEKTEKANIKLTNVDSIVTCENTLNSYYYDFNNSKIYLNVDISIDNLEIIVFESKLGIRINSNDIKVNVIGLNLIGFEQANIYGGLTVENTAELNLYDCKCYYCYTSNCYKMSHINNNIINCLSVGSGNDGFNFHYSGESKLINCEARYSYNDGMSHHENCVGYVNGYRAYRNGTTASVPAMGAWVYHENIISEENNFDNYRGYGAFGVLGGYGYDETTGIYINCKSKNDNLAVGYLTETSGGESVLLCENIKIENAITDFKGKGIAKYSIFSNSNIETKILENGATITII